ncbi:hypothetical protein VTK56DRAFT_3392 [Thermocarpiscus australiensis]
MSLSLSRKPRRDRSEETLLAIADSSTLPKLRLSTPHQSDLNPARISNLAPRCPSATSPCPRARPATRPCATSTRPRSGPLGYTIFKERDGHFCGLQNHRGSPDFWLHCGGEDFAPLDPALSADENREARGRAAQVAFGVGGRRLVDEWYRNAVKAGGIPNGELESGSSTPRGTMPRLCWTRWGIMSRLSPTINPWWLQLMQNAPRVMGVFLGALAAQLAWGYAKRAGWV